MSETTTEQLAEIEGQPEPVQVREGRWRTRGGDIKNIRPCEPLKGAYYVWPWTDGFMTFQDNGRHQGSKESPNDLVKYLGPLEQHPQPEPQADQIEELRSEISYVQNLLGESRQRVTQLEELVASLRTINEAQEKAVEAAGRQNDALRVQVRILQQEAYKKNSRIEFLETLNAGNGAAISDYRAQVANRQGLVDTARGQLEAAATEHDSLSAQLAAVKAELASVAADRYRLQVELDAAQQVPADSPELRQLRADLAEVTQDRDTYRHAHELLLNDANTAHERTKAMTVEAIAEWLQAFRGCNSPSLALLLLEALPSIMRSLTGLDREEIE